MILPPTGSCTWTVAADNGIDSLFLYQTIPNFASDAPLPATIAGGTGIYAQSQGQCIISDSNGIDGSTFAYACDIISF